MSRYHAVYVCDAYPGIGMGHLARALDVLAGMVRQDPALELGLAGGFSDSATAFLRRAIPDGVPVLPETDPDWASNLVVLDTMARPGDPVALDASRGEALAERCRRFALVSSSMEVETIPAVDLLIDHMPRVRIRGPRPGRCHFGFEYAPVSAEFFQADPVALDAADALVAVIGGSERQTGPAVLAASLPEGILESFGSLEMVVSPHYPAGALDALRRANPRWTIRRNVPSLAPLMAGARAVLCTYGNVTYQSLALGRPTFVFGYREFQRRYAEELEAMGLVVSCGLFEDPEMKKLALLASGDTLETLGERAASAGIGCGAEAIARVLLTEVRGVQNA